MGRGTTGSSWNSLSPHTNKTTNKRKDAEYVHPCAFFIQRLQKIQIQRP